MLDSLRHRIQNRIAREPRVIQALQGLRHSMLAPTSRLPLPMDGYRMEMRSSSDKMSDLVQLVEPDTIDVEETCRICMCELWEKEYTKNPLSQPKGTDHLPVQTVACRDPHMYHLGCIKQWIATKPVCPLCRNDLIVLTGYQPMHTGATMRAFTSHDSLEGFPQCGTITIVFTIPGGEQSMHCPMPFERFEDFVFETYLPNSDEGQHVHQMLQLAWNRRLLFRIGYNPRTKKMDHIVLNGLELKNHKFGGIQGNGFPDPYYLTGLKQDLKKMGIS